MELSQGRRREIYVASLLAGLGIGLCVTVLRIRQAGLTADLVASVLAGDQAEAVALLDQGADANATAWVGSFGTGRVMSARAAERGRSRPLTERTVHVPLLGLVFYLRRELEILPTARAQPSTTNPAATESPPKDYGLIRALLNHGANPNCYVGGTPVLTLAVIRRDHASVELLLDHGADPDLPDSSRSAPLFFADAADVRRLVSHHAHVDAAGFAGVTPLMRAAASRAPDGSDTVQALLEAGANPNARDRYRQTPLMHAVTAVAGQMLLDRGADPNARDATASTALMMYCQNRAERALIPLLLRRGALAGMRNSAGMSAVDYARRSPALKFYPRVGRGSRDSATLSQDEICRMLSAAEERERGVAARGPDPSHSRQR